MTPDGARESTTRFSGISDVNSARAKFAMVSISCGTTEFSGTRFNIWALIAYCLIIVGMELKMFCMLSLVILKKLVYKSTICLFISYCFKIILFCFLAWSARVYCSWACISSCDWFILSNLSSKLWILEDYKLPPGVDEEAPVVDPTRLCLALFAILVSTAGLEERGSSVSTMGSSTKSMLGAMNFLLRTSASTSAIGEVSCTLVSGGSSPPAGTYSLSSLRLTTLSSSTPYEIRVPTWSSSSCSSSSSSSSGGTIAFPFLPEALVVVFGCSCLST